MASAKTVEALTGQYPMRKIDRIRVRGKGEPVRLFQIFPPDSAPSNEMLEAFAAGRSAFIKRAWDEAERNFNAVLEMNPKDQVSTLDLERCRRFRQLEPPEHWDGVAML